MIRVFVYIFLVIFLLNCYSEKKENAVTKVDPSEERKSHVTSFFRSLDSTNEELKWSEIKSNLYINNQNQYGLKTTYGIDGEVTDIYLTSIWIGGKNGDSTVSLNQIIDTSSFIHLGNGFYKDNKNIYNHFAMADGGYFSVRKDIDYSSFIMFAEGGYAKDKYHVYDYQGRIIENADVHTFVEINTKKGTFGRDNKHYFAHNEIISIEEIKSDSIYKLVFNLN